MSLTHSVAEVLSKPVTLELEGIDRMYLNVYVPRLQRENQVAWYLREQHGARFASSALLEPITKQFLRAIDEFVQREHVPLVDFQPRQRKDDVTQEYLAKFQATEGVLYVGKAQEKARVVRTQRRVDPRTGAKYPWLVRSTAMVNHFYFYLVDADFGPLFLKFCSYFPYNAKRCRSGHEYLKRQLAREGIAFAALDNGLRSCVDVRRAQAICDDLSAERIDALLRKWLARLPHPFPREARLAGYRYALSILQAEFSLTQVLDQPVTGRVFFEQVIRENLDLGRPEQVQLIFARRINRRTPGTFRTRVLTEGVIPSLRVYYKNTSIKQYHQEGRALRTETTINDTRDFVIGKRLKNLPALRKIGFQANRRLLDVQRISHDCALGEQAFAQLQQPVTRDQQRVAGLRFGDPRVLALLTAIVAFRLQPRGFSNRELREQLAPLLGLRPGAFTQGRMTYDLRRLRLHDLIERIPKSHRYRVTEVGLRLALFVTRAYSRLLRPGLSELAPKALSTDSKLQRAFAVVDQEISAWCDRECLAA